MNYPFCELIPFSLSCAWCNHFFFIFSGALIYARDLPVTPLCMGLYGKYLALGMRDGSVMFCLASTGENILMFQAHKDRVRSIHFLSDSILITGSNKGVVKRWDLSNNPSDVTSIDVKEKVSGDVIPEMLRLEDTDEMDATSDERTLSTAKPSRFLDYYFREAIMDGDGLLESSKKTAGQQENELFSQQPSNNRNKSKISGVNGAVSNLISTMNLVQDTKEKSRLKGKRATTVASNPQVIESSSSEPSKSSSAEDDPSPPDRRVSVSLLFLSAESIVSRIIQCCIHFL